MGARRWWTDRWRAAKAPLRSHVARGWNRQPYLGLSRLCASYLRVWNNSDNYLTTNGETGVLDVLAEDDLTRVFDVGAHFGDWTVEVLKRRPDATVDCFEPTPSIAKDLAARLDGTGKVAIHEVALSDHNGSAELLIDPRYPSLNSITPRPQTGGEVIPTPVVLRTGDTFAADLGVSRIDLLKIDAEGHDFAVLKGFETMLAAGAISVVQFEYNGFSIFSRTLLIDYYEFLEPLGYSIGKIRPNGVNFKPYAASDENWVGPDCIAVHESRPDLRERLSAF